MFRQAIASCSVQRCSALRSYATVTTAKAPVSANVLPHDRTLAVLKNPKRTRRGSPIDVRRLFIFEQYAELLSSRAVFLMQNNNMTAKEYSDLKNDMREKGFIVTTVRNSVFGAAARKVAARKGGSRDVAKLATMLVGPCAVAFSRATDEEQPTLAKDFTDLAKKYKQKLLVVGAKFDGTVLTADTLNQVIKLPPLKQLRAELIGLLSQPAASLAGVLDRTPQTLLMSLQQHEKSLAEGSEKPSA
ncbi:hypothetical protein DFS34DRAFT_612875 [Phlyctochytrium arcticum]|nr:hypothetical protein DFS34DRAFT_612875 [Phlyctochytrium arcticum]